MRWKPWLSSLPVATGSSGRLYDENEALAVDDLDAAAGRQRRRRASAPDLAPDAHPAFALLPCHGFAVGADQRLLAGDDGMSSRSQQHGQYKEEQGGGH